MVIQRNCDFVKNTTTPIVSKIFPNAAGDVLTLQISGASGKVHLEGRNSSKGDWVSLAGIDLSDFSAVRGGFVKPGIYEIGIIGIRELRANVESTQGAISVFGQIISTEET